MRNKSNISLTAAEIAERWGFKAPSSVLRIMIRFGISGTKFGVTRQASRRFSSEDVELVETLAARAPRKKAAITHAT